MKSTRACASLALLVLTSCGLLNSDEVSVSQRDPVTGFVDGPGIDVCVDGTRIVSSALAKNGALGLCSKTGNKAVRCNAASDCRPSESCVCGQCTTRPCRSSTECGAREACQGSRCAATCSTNDDCADYEICSSGACAPLCGADEDCAYGEKCSRLDSTCIVKLCSPSVTCEATDDCVEQEVVADLREPHVGKKVAYLEIRSQAGGKTSCAIYRARVVNSRRWEIEPIQPVINPQASDDNCVGAPSVIERPDGIVLFGSRGDGKGIFRASSSDGYTFVRDSSDLWAPSQSWEDGWVGSPGAVRFQNKVVIAYQAARGKAIGLLVLDSDQAQANGVSEAPWLTPNDFDDSTFWRQTERVASPFLVSHNETLLVYLAVRGIEGSDAIPKGEAPYPADVNDSIGLLSTRDLLHGSRFPTGPILARRTNLRAYLGEMDPSVLLWDQGSWLVYVGSDASGASITGLGLAKTGQ